MVKALCAQLSMTRDKFFFKSNSDEERVSSSLRDPNQLIAGHPKIYTRVNSPALKVMSRVASTPICPSS